MNRKFSFGFAPVLLFSFSLLLMAGYYSGTRVVTTSGTPLKLSTASPAPPDSCISLTVQALSSNTGTIYLGGSNVSAAGKIGVALVNGAAPAASAYYAPSSTTALYSPSAIWVDATVSGDGVAYTCYK